MTLNSFARGQASGTFPGMSYRRLSNQFLQSFAVSLCYHENSRAAGYDASSSQLDGLREAVPRYGHAGNWLTSVRDIRAETL